MNHWITACVGAAMLGSSKRSVRNLSSEKIDAFFRKWLRLLPHPFSPADRQTGYRYALSMLQVELSLTQVLDRPAHGRQFFETALESLLKASRRRFMCSTRTRESTKKDKHCERNDD
jgi:hypothetical protein